MKILVEKFAFDTTFRPPIYCVQTFAEDDRNLVHSIDGNVRAVVPALAVADYLKSPNVRQSLTLEEISAINGAFSDFAE